MPGLGSGCPRPQDWAGEAEQGWATEFRCAQGMGYGVHIWVRTRAETLEG